MDTKIINSASLIAVSLLSVGKAVAADDKPMNVIFIMSDDHTTQGIGAYGSRLAKLNPTPTIDEFASDALIFNNAFVTNAISTPSRACIMTGQYSNNNEVLTLDEGLRTDQQYLVKEFDDMGYQTAMVGKWHLECEPNGFDYYTTLAGHGGQGTYFDPTFNSSSVEGKHWPNNMVQYNGYSSDVITNITIHWLEDRDKERPFFLMHHYKAPHDMFEYAPRYEFYLEDEEIPMPESLWDTDNWGSEATRGKNDSLRHIIGTSISPRHSIRSYVDDFVENPTGDYKRDTYLAYQEYLKRYLRCVKAVDDNLIRLFDYLKKEGLWENTIIVYTGDQGMMLGEHDLQDKRWMYDEAQRMPFIVRDPRSKMNGKHTDIMVNNIDYAATLIEMVGGEAPDYMDGKSFASIFEGKEPEGWKKAVYYRYWMHMIHHDIPAHIGVRTDRYKLILFYGRHYDLKREGEKSMAWIKSESNTISPTPVAFELYDLKRDPQEMNNVVDDPKYADVFVEMKQLLKLKREEAGDTDEAYPWIKEIIDAKLSE
ncbi:MAG: sulfatase [Rikenellaceae bacterium]